MAVPLLESSLSLGTNFKQRKVSTGDEATTLWNQLNPNHITKPLGKTRATYFKAENISTYSRQQPTLGARQMKHHLFKKSTYFSVSSKTKVAN